MSQISLFTRPGSCKSLSGCVFTTAFCFCFGLYALYKYALIDAESVLNNNLGKSGSFDYGEYGIDVSSLRAISAYQNEAGASVSKVDQWDAFVKKENGVRMAYIADDCDAPAEVRGVAFLAKNERGGLKVVVLVNYTAGQDINVGTGEAVILAKFGKVIVLNQTLELCSVDEELLKCPIKKGYEFYRREVVLPRFAPKGRYHGTATLRYRESKKIELCAKGMMIL